MKIIRIIVLLLTAAVAFSACDSPTDVTDKQNIIPVGGLPVKSVNVDIQKAVNSGVNNSFKGVDVSTSFNPATSFIDLNSKIPYITMKLTADVPLPSSQSGIFMKSFSLNVNNVIADGRPYMIQGGNNQSATTAAVFNTVTFYNDQGQMRIDNNPPLVPATSDSAVVYFTHDPVNKTIIGNLLAFMTKDTVIRVSYNITSEEADSVFQQYEAMGFEIKNQKPEIDTVNSEIIFPAMQILLNVRSKITVQY